MMPNMLRLPETGQAGACRTGFPTGAWEPA